MGQALSLAVCVGIPVANSTVSVILNRRKNDTWYQDLKKPKWTPPRWLFGLMDIAFHASMGTASWFIWKQGFKEQKTPLIIYGSQLLLNLLYNQMFYQCHEIGTAFVDILCSPASWGSVMECGLVIDCLATCATVLFFKESKAAGSLLVPYVAYAYFCTALNARTLWLKESNVTPPPAFQQCVSLQGGEAEATETKETGTKASSSAPAGAKVDATPKTGAAKVEPPKAEAPKTGTGSGTKTT